ncbi:MAG: SDR family NAD(P)-dependent oxidoreductase [Acidimicrobiales bacterium]|nr:SDR family NAD(P)-dependent oxidoreductase [Acidimicrobiales bacterium]
MRVLVTGGAGFIGSALVDQLVKRGDQVLVIDNFSTGSQKNLEEAKNTSVEDLAIENCDIRNSETTKLIADYKPSIIFHLAAQVDVRASVEDPLTDLETNLVGLIRVLEGGRKAETRKIIFASSGGTIYGEPEAKQLPLNEDTPWNPLSPYGVSKLAGGLYVNTYSSLHGLKGTTLALSNVYGPRQDPHGEAGVVAIFAGKLLEREPCTIYGTGMQTRDFIYVEDVASAFVASIENGDGKLFNIGTGTETSIQHLYKEMALAVGIDIDSGKEVGRSGEIERSSLDPSLAGKILGWKPTTNLRDGIHSTLEWFESKKDENS